MIPKETIANPSRGHWLKRSGLKSLRAQGFQNPKPVEPNPNPKTPRETSKKMNPKPRKLSPKSVTSKNPYH